MNDPQKDFSELMLEAEIREANRRFRKRRLRMRISFVLTVVVGWAGCIASISNPTSLSERILFILYLGILMHHLSMSQIPRLFGLPEASSSNRQPASQSMLVEVGKRIALFGPLLVNFFDPLFQRLFEALFQ